jgi:hypothetical protein
MRRAFGLAFCFSLTALLALAQSQPAARHPAVAIFMEFDSAPGLVPLTVMKQEVDDLMQPAGVTLSWNLIKENTGRQTYAGLAVVKFKGACKVASWRQPVNDFGSLGERRALGSTRVTDGRVQPYSEVECDQVRQALSYLAPGADMREKQQALGRALARVVAHELYHVFAKTTEHAAKGLAKASQPLQELVSADKLTFLESDWLAIGRVFTK